MVRHGERKALQIHNLYVVIKGTKISSTAYAHFSLSMAALVDPLCGKRETHNHGISNTYVPFTQLFAKGKSLKSEGIGITRDKNKGPESVARSHSEARGFTRLLWPNISSTKYQRHSFKLFCLCPAFYYIFSISVFSWWPQIGSLWNDKPSTRYNDTQKRSCILCACSKII
jgi:hypothetical protein